MDGTNLAVSARLAGELGRPYAFAFTCSDGAAEALAIY